MENKKKLEEECKKLRDECWRELCKKFNNDYEEINEYLDGLKEENKLMG